jgi:hypothetical protein
MRKAKHLLATDSDEHVAEELDTAMTLLADDGNVVVAALGALVVSAEGTYDSARSADNAAKVASETATDTKNSKKSLGIAAYNNAVDEVNKVYPNNPDKYTALGLNASKERTDRGKCPKITGGKADQWIHDGFAELSWESLGVLADFYTLEECTGDPAVEANWYAASPANSKEAKKVIVKPKALNVPTNWRVTGNNTAGVGVAPSDPFGGDPIH